MIISAGRVPSIDLTWPDMHASDCHFHLAANLSLCVDNAPGNRARAASVVS